MSTYIEIQKFVQRHHGFVPKNGWIAHVRQDSAHPHGAPHEPLPGWEQRHARSQLDQLRTVDGDRLIRRLGRLAPDALRHVSTGLLEMFAE
jgi:mRNA-degrading endonuclease toxin of MazEF toxin-antitoxin module